MGNRKRGVRPGDRVKDSITGFEGTVTSVTEYLYGCVRCGVEGKGSDGKPEEFVFDEQRLTRAPAATSGGARPVPARTGLR